MGEGWGRGVAPTSSSLSHCTVKARGLAKGERGEEVVSGRVPAKKAPSAHPCPGTALGLAHLAEPPGEPYLLHGHVIRENFIVKKELHLAGSGEHRVRNSPGPSKLR